MKKAGKVSFSIPNQRRRRLIKPPACLAADEGELDRSRLTPALQFITEFDPSETVTPGAAAPAIVIAPLPNDFYMFRREPCDGSSRNTPTIIEEGVVFTREPDNNPRSSSHHAYGLNLPRSAPAATDNKEFNAPPRQVVTTSSELLQRPFKQEDTATLSDHHDTEEFPKFSAEELAAAILAGYGWSKGQGIGRNNKKKGDTKVFTYGRRPVTGAQSQTFGLGCNPTEMSEADKKRKRQDNREQERVGSVRLRPRRSKCC